MSGWHVGETDLETYRTGSAPALLVDSVEAHLLRCAQCRLALAATGGPGAAAASERRWVAVSAAVDGSTPSPLVRLGVATRPLAVALTVAALLLVALPLLVAAAAGADRVPTVLLAAAPLAPMVAVAFAYRRESDPAGELSLAAPLAGIRLVAHRSLLVSAVGVPLGVVTALAVGVPAGVALAWLLPGLALSGAVLLAGTTRLDPAAVAAAVGGAWAVGVTLADRRGSSALVVDLVAGAPVQLGSLLAAVVVLGSAVARRDRLAYRSEL